MTFLCFEFQEDSFSISEYLKPRKASWRRVVPLRGQHALNNVQLSWHNFDKLQHILWLLRAKVWKIRHIKNFIFNIFNIFRKNSSLSHLVFGAFLVIKFSSFYKISEKKFSMTRFKYNPLAIHTLSNACYQTECNVGKGNKVLLNCFCEHRDHNY